MMHSFFLVLIYILHYFFNFTFQPSHRILKFSHHIFLISSNSFLVSQYSFHTAWYIAILMLFIVSQLSLKIFIIDFIFCFFPSNNNTITSRYFVCFYCILFKLQAFLMCLMIPEYLLIFKNKAVSKLIGSPMNMSRV